MERWISSSWPQPERSRGLSHTFHPEFNGKYSALVPNEFLSPDATVTPSQQIQRRHQGIINQSQIQTELLCYALKPVIAPSSRFSSEPSVKSRQTVPVQSNHTRLPLTSPHTAGKKKKREGVLNRCIIHGANDPERTREGDQTLSSI